LLQNAYKFHERWASMKRTIALVWTFLAIGLGMSQASQINAQELLTPWQASVSIQYTRAEFPAMQKSLAAWNAGNTTPTPVSFNGRRSASFLSDLSPISTNSWINLAGGEVALQQNFNSWFAGQMNVSGALGNRRINVPAVDKQAFGGTDPSFEPRFITVGYGPLFTFHRDRKYQPWIHAVPGFAHADLNPSQPLRLDILNADPAIRFSSNSFALQAGIGMDMLIHRHVALRFAGDDISTWLFNTQNNQLRATFGLAWRFGNGQFDY
jgi:hypothetical protein